MPEYRWIRARDHVLIEEGQGGAARPASALEVFASAFGSSATDAQDSQGVVQQLPELRFSRIPAALALRLSGVLPGRITLERGVWARNSFVPVEVSSDQVIHEEVWQPIRVDDQLELSQSLHTLGLSADAPLGIGDVIRLRQSTPAGVKLIEQITTLSGAGNEQPMPVPGLDATLYPYQAFGVEFLRSISKENVGCLLADEMGLGKTLQVIGLLQAEQNEGMSSSLVIAPATLLENWRRELARFAPALKVVVHSGRERAGVAAILQSFDVVVTTYETALRDELLLGSIRWNILVLDEAQSIKNPAAQRTLSIKGLRRRVSVAVTGTPVENRLEDLWSISDYCLPGLLGDLSEFRKSFGDTNHDASELGKLVAPIVLRRRVLDVAQDLPELIEIPQPIVMSERLASAYESVRAASISSGSPSLAMLMPLRQVAAHPVLSGPWTSDMSEDAPKHVRLLEILEEAFARNQKVLVFAGFQRLIDLLREDLQQRWPSGYFHQIDGRTAVEERQLIVDGFSTVAAFGALLLNPKAAGTGLNITAANHVIHYTPEWNPAVTAQANARAYRRKQMLPVTVHHLFYAHTIEEIMVLRAQTKRQLAAGVAEQQLEPSISDISLALQATPIGRATS